jgi:nicotinamidase-related amidase
MKLSLLVIDMQKEFFEISPACTQSLNDSVEYINAAIEIFREKELPVICIQHMNEEDSLIPGEAGFDLPEELHVLPTDLHITKAKSNSFVKTQLEEELRKLGVETLILTGFCAEFCVLSTYRGAQDLDLKPILLRGSLASYEPDRIKFVEDISDVISYGALKHFVG